MIKLETKKLVNRVLHNDLELGERIRVKETVYGGVNHYMFSYTHIAMFRNEWKPLECISRGIVIDQYGVIKCLPFDKFFNYGQVTNNGQDIHLPDSKILEVWEKVDGSLLNVWHTGEQWTCSTRGAFNSEQALIGQKFLDNMDLSNLPLGYTYIFEIVYPDNRIVVDYGDFNGLVLLARRSIVTGNYANAEILHKIKDKYFDYPFIRIAKYLSKMSIDDIIANLPSLTINNEGFVAVFADGTRLKFKGNAYLIAHKAISNLNQKAVMEAMRDNTYAEYIGDLPDEFRDIADNIAEQIQKTFDATKLLAENIFSKIYMDGMTRREFAMNAKDYPFSSLLFFKLDGNLTDKKIWYYLKTHMPKEN